MPRAALVVLICLCVVGAGRADVLTRHDMTAAEYADWLKEVEKKAYRPLLVSVHTIRQPVFAAVAVPNTGKLAWVARHGLARQDYQRIYEEQVNKGFRLLCVSGYRHRREDRYAAVWVKDTHEFGWSATHGVVAQDYL